MNEGQRHTLFLFLEPWVGVGELAKNLVAELRNEVSAGHVLYSMPARAIARRTDNDVVLSEVDSPSFRYAVMHLTSNPESDPRWPSSETYASFAEWVKTRMKPDNQGI